MDIFCNIGLGLPNISTELLTFEIQNKSPVSLSENFYSNPLSLGTIEKNGSDSNSTPPHKIESA